MSCYFLKKRNAFYCLGDIAGINATQYNEQFIQLYTLTMTQLKQVTIIHYFVMCLDVLCCFVLSCILLYIIFVFFKYFYIFLCYL